MAFFSGRFDQTDPRSWIRDGFAFGPACAVTLALAPCWIGEVIPVIERLADFDTTEVAGGEGRTEGAAEVTGVAVAGDGTAEGTGAGALGKTPIGTCGVWVVTPAEGFLSWRAVQPDKPSVTARITDRVHRWITFTSRPPCGHTLLPLNRLTIWQQVDPSLATLPLLYTYTKYSYLFAAMPYHVLTRSSQLATTGAPCGCPFPTLSLTASTRSRESSSGHSEWGISSSPRQ